MKVERRCMPVIASRLGGRRPVTSLMGLRGLWNVWIQVGRMRIPMVGASEYLVLTDA